MPDKEDASPPDLDAMCREAVAAWRLQAFDNIDVAGLLAARPIARHTALWIGRHLMRNSRRLDAYRAGQAIVALATQRRAHEDISHAP